MNSIVPAFLGGAAALLFTVVMERFLVGYLPRFGVLDLPNQRSSHKRPTPRGGGMGIGLGVLAGFVAGYFLGVGFPPFWLLLATGVVALVGLADDILGGIPFWLRLAVQFLASSIVLVSAGSLDRLPLPGSAAVSLVWLAWPVSFLWLVGVTNIYNFLDGIDGFAGMQAVIAGVALVIAFPKVSAGQVGWIVAAAAAGFLFFNWEPARLFMGDVGSSTLGFLFAAIPFTLPHASRPSGVWLIGMALWFFLADGSWTVLRRVARGERIWEAHREHLYQQLVRSGWSHARVTSAVMSAGAVVAGSGVWAIRSGNVDDQWYIMGLAVVAFVAYLAIVRVVRGRR